ncbi:MAG: hypothetical protein JNM07_10080 [Phycisphaerae bacterium]|nr:hypothetical protein [Phycisphaerae bacterium]
MIKQVMLCAGVALVPINLAAGQVFTWTNPSGGNWSVPANWDLMTVPNSGDHAAIIGAAGAYTVTLDLPATALRSLVVSNPFARLDVPGGKTLNLGGGNTEISGLLVVNPTADNLPTSVVISGAILNGSGVIRLGAASAANTQFAQLRSASSNQVVLREGLTVEGSGQVVGRWKNWGLIDANGAGRSLDVVPQGNLFTNAGVLRARNGGTLRLGTGEYSQIVQGTIVADGGRVEFPAGGTVRGGRMEAFNGGRFALGADAQPVTLRDVEWVVGDIDIPAGRRLIISASAFLHKGTINIDPSGGGAGAATLDFSRSCAFTGETRVALRGPTNSDNAILTAGNGTVTVGPNSSVTGSGYIAARAINQGLVEASGADAGLVITSPSFSNQGKVRASLGGKVTLRSAAFTQANDGKIVADGGTVQFEAAVSGGALIAQRQGRLIAGPNRTPTLTGARIEGTFEIPGSGTLAVGAGGLLQFGNLVVNSNLSATSKGELRFTAGGTHAGQGETILNAPQLAALALLNNTGAEPVVHSPTRTIRGRGQISGIHTIAGLLAPGFGSGDRIATIQVVSGPITLAPTATLAIDIGSLDAFDRLTGSGAVNLGGTLDVRLVGEFTPSLGDSVAIVAVGSRSGEFGSVDAPPLPDPGWAWKVSYTPTGAALFVGLQADFNSDGVLDDFDIFDFLAALAAGASSADFNRDGDIDDFDLFDFLSAFPRV